MPRTVWFRQCQLQSWYVIRTRKRRLMVSPSLIMGVASRLDRTRWSRRRCSRSHPRDAGEARVHQHPRQRSGDVVACVLKAVQDPHGEEGQSPQEAPWRSQSRKWTSPPAFRRSRAAASVRCLSAGVRWWKKRLETIRSNDAGSKGGAVPLPLPEIDLSAQRSHLPTGDGERFRFRVQTHQARPRAPHPQAREQAPRAAATTGS